MGALTSVVHSAQLSKRFRLCSISIAYLTRYEQGQHVQETREYKETISRSLESSGNYQIRVPIIVYTGNKADPKWLSDDPSESRCC
jgi:hypothetical protein